MSSFAHQSRQREYSPNHSVGNNKGNMFASNELHVGDLSYFCEEKHLYELFKNFGCVKSCRIVRNYNQTRSLMFGFVMMSTTSEAVLAASYLNGQMFMGRKLKVEQSVHREKNSSQQSYNADTGFQLHVSFSSTFMPHEIIIPTEEFLTEIFRPFGCINDILIRAYTISPDPYKHWQEGYGFVSFRDEVSAAMAVEYCNPSRIFRGITIKAVFSLRSQSNCVSPHGAKSVPKAYPNSRPISNCSPVLTLPIQSINTAASVASSISSSYCSDSSDEPCYELYNSSCSPSICPSPRDSSKQSWVSPRGTDRSNCRPASFATGGASVRLNHYPANNKPAPVHAPAPVTCSNSATTTTQQFSIHLPHDNRKYETMTFQDDLRNNQCTSDHDDGTIDFTFQNTVCPSLNYVEDPSATHVNAWLPW